MIKNILAALLIAYGLLGNSIFDVLDSPTPTPLPTVTVNEPAEAIKAVVAPIAAVVTEADDRVDVALYFLELSKRLPNYEDITLQQLNDLVRHSATAVFKGNLVGKYDGFDEGLVKNIIRIAGDTEHTLSVKEKKDLSDLFEGIAWSLVQIKKG